MLCDTLLLTLCNVALRSMVEGHLSNFPNCGAGNILVCVFGGTVWGRRFSLSLHLRVDDVYLEVAFTENYAGESGQSRFLSVM